jgi:molecular chaperone GrpE (heat shock protein)
MKVGSKRRRTKQEIEDQKLEDRVKRQAVEDKLKTIDNLQAELQSTQQQVLDNQDAKDIVQNMLDQGFVQINPDGVMVPG